MNPINYYKNQAFTITLKDIKKSAKYENTWHF
jgi:hypothetical protein